MIHTIVYGMIVYYLSNILIDSWGCESKMTRDITPISKFKSLINLDYLSILNRSISRSISILGQARAQRDQSQSRGFSFCFFVHYFSATSLFFSASHFIIILAICHPDMCQAGEITAFQEIQSKLHTALHGIITYRVFLI